VPLWGRWGYALDGQDEFVLYLPYITWLSDYSALMYEPGPLECVSCQVFGDWHVTPNFAAEASSLYRSYYP
jgi:hypothetical protein